MRGFASARRFEASEWPVYRELRLRALADSPDAFGSTLASEQTRSGEDWAARIAAAATSGRDLPIIAEVDRKPAGLAWAKFDATNPSAVNIYQMWVAPEFRGQGIGRMLLRAAIEWAGDQNATEVHLAVTCGQTPAMRLYTSEGFRPTGQSEPLRPGSLLLAQPMALSLAKHTSSR